MGRKPRQVTAGGIYHVTARRLEGKELFSSRQDFIRMKTLLHQALDKYVVEYLAYCLMGNHYHLLIRTPEGNLSEFMHWLNSRYSNYYNLAYDHDGHVFQGRYDCQTVKEDSYLLEASRYIHLNPVRAKLVPGPEFYPYSSYRLYLGQQDWLPVVTEDILGYFNQPHEYWEFVREGIKEEELSQVDSARQLLVEFAFMHRLNLEQLVNPQNSDQRYARRAAIAMLAAKTTLSPKEIGSLTGITSPATLYRLLKK